MVCFKGPGVLALHLLHFFHLFTSILLPLFSSIPLCQPVFFLSTSFIFPFFLLYPSCSSIPSLNSLHHISNLYTYFPFSIQDPDLLNKHHMRWFRNFPFFMGLYSEHSLQWDFALRHEQKCDSSNPETSF